MPPHQQKQKKLGRAAKRRLRAARIARMHQQAAQAAQSAQTASTQPTQQFEPMHSGEDDPTFTNIRLMGGQAVALRSNVDPNLGPYHFKLTLRMLDRNGPDGYSSKEYIKHYYNDGDSFKGVSPAAAFEMVQATVEDQYGNRSGYAGVEIVQDANHIDWANVEIQHGSSYGDPYSLDTPPGYYHDLPDTGDTLLFMGTPVVDQSVIKAKPAYATPASYMQVTDEECFARALAEVLTGRAQKAGGQVRLQSRVPQPKRHKGTLYAIPGDIIKLLNRMFPDRLEPDGQGGIIGGITANEIVDFCRGEDLHCIIFNRWGKITHNGDFRTPGQLKNHSRPKTIIIVAAHEHVYMLKDGDEARRICLAVAQLVYKNSPAGKRDPSVAVGRYVHPNLSDLANQFYTLDAKGKRVKLDDTRPFITIDGPDVPEFDEMDEAIYVMDQRQVVDQYEKYVETRGIPSFWHVRMDGTVLREFSFFKDEQSLSGMVTLHSPGSHIRPELYEPLVLEAFRSLFGTEKFVSSGRRFGYTHLCDGPGTLVAMMTREILGARQIPSADTKRRVLAKQDMTCPECDLKFTTSEFAQDDEEEVEGERKPKWEHVRPVKAGGDGSEKNIRAVCLPCMLDKNSRERAEHAYRGAERIFKSTLNSTVLEQVHEHGVPTKSRQFNSWAKMITCETEVPEGMIAVDIDLEKSRRFQICGEYREQGWPVFSVNDQWEDFDGDISKLGEYRVESTDDTLLHGCGFYGDDILREALADGLIELSDIKEQLRPSTVLERDFFQKIIREIEKHMVAACKKLLAEGADAEQLEMARKKVFKDFCGNMLVGVLGQPRKSKYSYYTTLDYDEAMEMSAQPGCVSMQIVQSCGRDAWHLTMVNHSISDGWVRNIYKIVIEGERLQAYRLAKRFRAMGGTVMYIKTDAVGGYIAPADWRPLEFSQETYTHVETWDDSKKHAGRPLKYKFGELNGLTAKHTQVCRERPPTHRLPRRLAKAWPDVLPNAPVTPWTIAANMPPPPPPTNPTAPLVPTSAGRLDGLKAVRALGKTIVDSGAGLHITGEGGSGKTFLVKEGIVPELVERDIPFQIAAPTLVVREGFRAHKDCREHSCTVQHLLAQYVKSPETLIRLLGIRPDKPFYMIIDEVSMLNESMFEMLSVLQNECKQIRFILVGDFGQLPPVMDPLLEAQDGGARTATYENSAVMHALAGDNRLVLTHSHRLVKGQEWFRAACLAVRNGEEIDLAPFAVKDEHVNTHICYTNDKCKQVNAKRDAHHREQNPEHTPIFLEAAEARPRTRKRPPPIDENAPPTPPPHSNSRATTPVTSAKRQPPKPPSKKKRSQDLHVIPGTRLVGIDSGGGRPEGGLSDEYNIINRQRYEVVAVSETQMTLKTLDTDVQKQVTIDAQGATRLLALGWAVTFYCVQGVTLRDFYTIHEWHHFCSSARARYVAMTRAVRGEHVQIDQSDEPYDTLRPPETSQPSLLSVRKEYVDADAWESLRMRAHAELDPASDGMAYFKRFESGVRGECDAGEQRYYIKTRYVMTTGRRTARVEGPGMPLQQIAKPLHKLLLSAHGHDIDIKAAHPTLLVQYLARFADAPEAAHIREYAADKGAVQARIAEELAAAGCPGVAAGTIKAGVVRAMFLGRLAGWLRKELGVLGDVEEVCPTLARLAADFAEAAAFVAAQNPTAVENAKTRHEAQGREGFANPIAGGVSEVLNGIETRVVAAIEDSLTCESGMAVRAVVYDGLVTHSFDTDVKEVAPEALRLAEKRAQQATGYAVELVEKQLYRLGSEAEAIAFLRAYAASE